MIAACDTFRAGAVEQLRTHKQKLDALHPAKAHGGRPMIYLYEQGYDKDPAGVAMAAINQGNHSVCVAEALNSLQAKGESARMASNSRLMDLQLLTYPVHCLEIDMKSTKSSNLMSLLT